MRKQTTFLITAAILLTAIVSVALYNVKQQMHKAICLLQGLWLQPIKHPHAATVAVEVTPMVVTASTWIVATAFMYMVASATTITGKFH